MEKADLFKIIFNDEKLNILVATDLSYRECEELISRQEEPTFYKIEKLAPETKNQSGNCG